MFPAGAADESNAAEAALRDALSYAQDLTAWAKWEADKWRSGPLAAYVGDMARKRGVNVVLYRTAADLEAAGVDRDMTGGGGESPFDEAGLNGVSSGVSGFAAPDGTVFVNANNAVSPLDVAVTVDHETFHSRFGEFVSSKAPQLAEKLGVSADLMKSDPTCSEESSCLP